MEASTGRRSKLSNPRICIRVRADQDLPEEVFYRDKSGSMIGIKVSYPWKPKPCSGCKSFGHAPDSCPVHRTTGKAAISKKQIVQQKVYRAKKIVEGSVVPVSNAFAALQDLQNEDGKLAVEASVAATSGVPEEGIGHSKETSSLGAPPSVSESDSELPAVQSVIPFLHVSDVDGGVIAELSNSIQEVILASSSKVLEKTDFSALGDSVSVSKLAGVHSENSVLHVADFFEKLDNSNPNQKGSTDSFGSGEDLDRNLYSDFAVSADLNSDCVELESSSVQHLSICSLVGHSVDQKQTLEGSFLPGLEAFSDPPKVEKGLSKKSSHSGRVLRSNLKKVIKTNQVNLVTNPNPSL
uniref:Syntaxin-7A n=1 Tax=Anthurium amnicola TaxID=1678845 RepID=A0A1D1YD48_9ARAE